VSKSNANLGEVFVKGADGQPRVATEAELAELRQSHDFKNKGEPEYSIKDVTERLSKIKQSIPNAVDISKLPKAKQEEAMKTVKAMAERMTQVMPDTEAATAPVDEEVPVVPEVVEDDTRGLSMCPNCSWNTKKMLPVVSEEDKAAWLRALLGGKRFTKTFDMYGGKLKVTFRSRSQSEQRLILDQAQSELGAYKTQGAPQNIVTMQFNSRLLRLQMVTSLVHITGMSREMPEIESHDAMKMYFGATKDSEFGKVNIAAAAEAVVTAKWQDSLYNAVFKSFIMFETLCNRLQETAVSEDFWVGTASYI